MGILIFLAIPLILVLYVVSTYNKFVSVGNKVDEALSGIDVALARRYDTLANMVEVVKGYTKHEKEVLVSLVKLRNAPTMDERLSADENYNEATSKLIAIKETYPELKASQNFLELQKTIRDVEDHLSASRRMYNANVTIYNDLLYSFPTNVIGNYTNATRKEYFGASEAQIQRVDIEM